MAYAIQITPINGWTSDGASLEKQEKGCGDLDGSWQFGSWSNGTQWAAFNIDVLLEAGCIERAIASAGGPKGLKCYGMGRFKSYLQESFGTGDVKIVEKIHEASPTSLLGPTHLLLISTAAATASLLHLAVPGFAS